MRLSANGIPCAAVGRRELAALRNQNTVLTGGTGIVYYLNMYSRKEPGDAQTRG